MKPKILAITLGDPGGIGPEVIVKALGQRQKNSGVYHLVVGTPAPFEILKKKFSYSLPFHFVNNFDFGLWSKTKINFWDIAPHSSKILNFQIGKVSKQNAVLTYKTLAWTAQKAAQGALDAIVTAPINKTTMRLVDPGFHGHTEFLAETSQTKSFAMMFVGAKLKVTLVTIHEPISRVSRLIKKKNVLEKIILTSDFLKKRFKIKRPRIGVCALNPHGRETGPEDEKEIRPAVEAARKKGILAFGPLSADGLFHEAYEGNYDGVVSMYHDQGLAPFKMISFRDGVNLTLGLPYVRTSPDHGTAFDIAYQNKADASSFLSALNLAQRLIL